MGDDNKTGKNIGKGIIGWLIFEGGKWAIKRYAPEVVEGAKTLASKAIKVVTGHETDHLKKVQKQQKIAHQKLDNQVLQEALREEKLREKANKLREKQQQENPPQASAFTLEEAEKIPEREWLIDGWLYDNDLAIFFGPPKAGKSTLAMQIARDLAEGRKSQIFPMEQCRKKQWVIYYHLEMNPEEVMADYPDLMSTKNSSYFIKPEGIDTPKALVEDIRKQIETIKRKNITVIVDNLSKLGNACSDKKLLDLISKLKDDMRRKCGVNLTIILLNHTDKDKFKQHKKLESTMMRGSEGLYREAGLLFCINNTSEGKDIKMIKMNDRRNSELKEEVIVVKRTKTPEGRLQFERMREDNETDLLPPKEDNARMRTEKQRNAHPEAKPTRGRNLKLRPEQKARIVEIYHLCGDNLNAAAKAIEKSDEALLCEIEKFAPLQVSRIVEEHEKQQKTPIIDMSKKMA